MGSISVSPRKDWISPWRWSRSQGTAVNCVRCVSSCRQTQSRKSCGSTSSSRSTWTMLGATRSSRPPPFSPAGRSREAGAKVSYWPRTREDMKDSSMPTSTPVTLPPTAPRTAPPGVPLRRSCILSSSGLSSSRKPATLARTQPGRSTTRTGVSCAPASPSRVKPRTCSSEALACLRSSVTTARASSRLTSGPGRTKRVAVATARFQSTIPDAAPPMRVMSSTVRERCRWGQVEEGRPF